MDVPSLWKGTNIFYNVLCFLISENEKLFDRNDARLYWKTVLHLYSLYHHSYVAVFANNLALETHEEYEIRKLYTFRAGYLTGWNFTFQTVFLILALIYDAMEWVNKHESSIAKKIAYWRDVLFNALVVPYTLFVSIMFWSIYAVDRELVFPKIYDVIIPWWFNHCVHTNITVVILVETLLTARRYPTCRSLELKLNTIIAFGYAAVYYAIYYFTGRWLYNVFGVLTWWQVCLYQLAIWSSSYIFYFIHFPINRIIHGCEPEDSNAADKEEKINEVENTDSSLEKNSIISKSDTFTADTWSLKYRPDKENIENSRL